MPCPDHSSSPALPPGRRGRGGFIIASLVGTLVASAADEPRLLFKSGFEADTRVALGTFLRDGTHQHHLTGLDRTSGYDWRESLVRAGLVSDAFFQYVISSRAAPETFVTTEIRTMPGPEGTPSRVLYLGVKGDDATNSALSRNEYDVHPTEAWRQGYSRYWMFMPADMREKAQEKSWIMVMEWKEPRNPEVSTGGTNNWRTNITLSSGNSDRLVWQFLRQEVQPERRDEQKIVNVDAPVPVGRWFLLESFWRWGRDGRIWFAIDGRTIFDQSGRFEHATNPLGLKFWALFKNYRAQHFYDADLSNGDESWFAYDDVEIWSDFPAGHPRRDTEPLIVENFDFPDTEWGTLPAGWWLEGATSGARARISEGRLLVDATRPKTIAATVWYDRELPAEVEVSFDVHVVDAVKSENNMNLFFQFRDPSSPSGLRASREERGDGKYTRYHSERLHGTILTFLANGTEEEARVRVRQVPPFNPVVQEFNGYHARTGRTYHVRVVRRGERFTCHVDGRKRIDTILPVRERDQPGGYLGFRTWHTKLWWDNLVVRRPAAE